MNNLAQKLLPDIDSIVDNGDKVLLNLSIDESLRCFRGHFDDAPVVPGVVQLDWAITFCKRYLSISGDVVDVSVLKFQSLIMPNTTLQLELVKKSDQKITFSYTKDAVKYSSARVEFS